MDSAREPAIDRLLPALFPGESGAARLRLFGLLVTVIVFAEGDAPVSAARLAILTGMSARQIRRDLRRLLALGLVEEPRVAGARGQGAARLAVRATEKARRLDEALLQPG